MGEIEYVSESTRDRWNAYPLISVRSYQTAVNLEHFKDNAYGSSLTLGSGRRDHREETSLSVSPVVLTMLNRGGLSGKHLSSSLVFIEFKYFLC